ncbi:MAG: hypothetical protein QY317_16120 [Candidatus Jettenia caeni]|nr:MAG: hypothetical protein QY317_16120 [Candidatus Jettenia caeni]
MKQLMYICLVVVSITGCTSHDASARIFGGPESPRPDKTQISAAQSITENSVPVIVGAQTDKQDKISIVAQKAIESIIQAKEASQVEGITNIAANAIRGIKDSDGTAKILGHAQEKAVGDILQMKMSEYMAYAAGQSVVASNNRDIAYRGIVTGFQWTKSNLGLITGLATMLFGGGIGGRVLASKLSSVRDIAEKRSNLLIEQARAIEEWKKNNPDKRQIWEDMRNYLTKVHSKTPLDVKKELDLTV